MIEAPILPHNLDAERVLLAGLLLNDEAYPEVATLLSGAQDFFDHAHRKIYAAIVELAEAGKPIDQLLLAHILGERGQLAQVGGVAYISSLLDGAVRRSSLKHAAGLVASAAQKRSLIHLCDQAARTAADGASDINDCKRVLNDGLLSIEAASTQQQALHVVQFSDEVFADIERMRKHSGELIGLSSGIGSLDLVTTGLRKGEFWVLGGRPGEGKSALALQCVTENIKVGVPVAVFSIEMSRHQVLTRIWSQHGNIPFEKLRDPGRLRPEEYEKLRETMIQVGQMPLYVDDSGSLSIERLVARARLLIKRHQIQLIVVDYVQLVDAKATDERQRVSRISNNLRELAKEGVALLALSQLARPKDGALNTRPNKFNLKESGSLEADAHTVLLIYRPVDKQDRPTGEDEIVVAKQRNGPWSIEPVSFDSRCLKYQERA